MRKTALDYVYTLAKKDKRVVFLGSDLSPNVLSNFKNEIPERFFMEGIYEQHLIGMAAGMAMEGLIPYVNTISTFITRRCFEQNVIDIGLHNLNVRLIGNGGGLVYAPLGPTHLATDDIAIMRTIPNMTIITAADHEEIYRIMPQTLEHKGPIYIRLTKGFDPVVTDNAKKSIIGKANQYNKKSEILIVTFGKTLEISLEAAKYYNLKGIEVCVLHYNTVKPFDEKKLIELSKNAKLIITVEEHSIIGGLKSIVSEVLLSNLKKIDFKFISLGIKDEFIENYGTQDELMKSQGLSSNNIIKIISKFLKGK